MANRVCLFCGGRGVTREHVLPKWFAKTTLSQWLFTPIVSLSYSAFDSTTDPAAKMRTYGQTGLPNLKVKQFCERCNSGWMSVLEKTFQPLLERLLVPGSAFTLTRAECELAATWALKTMMVFDRMRAENAIISQRQNRELFDLKAPIPNSWAWLGRLDSDPSFNVWPFAFQVRDPSGPPELIARPKVNLRTTTFIFGDVVLKSMLWCGNWDWPPGWGPSEAFTNLRIWPGGGPHDWPGSPVLTDERLGALVSKEPGPGGPAVYAERFRVEP